MESGRDDEKHQSGWVPILLVGWSGMLFGQRLKGNRNKPCGSVGKRFSKKEQPVQRPRLGEGEVGLFEEEEAIVTGGK